MNETFVFPTSSKGSAPLLFGRGDDGNLVRLFSPKSCRDRRVRLGIFSVSEHDIRRSGHRYREDAGECPLHKERERGRWHMERADELKEHVRRKSCNDACEDALPDAPPNE